MNKQGKNQKITINELSLLVYLGITEKEKQNLQEIRWTIEMEFESFVDIKDKSKSVVCYDDIISKVILFSQSQKFDLIENMVRSCFDFLKKDLQSKKLQFLKINLCKVHPPLSSLGDFVLKGGVSFEYQERL